MYIYQRVFVGYYRVVVELEKTQTRSLAVYGVYDETKRHFKMPIFFLFR